MTTVFPNLIYDDADKAIDFLERTLGFERRDVHQNDAGKVVHAELKFRDAWLMLSERGAGDPRFDPGGKTLVYIAIDEPQDIDRLYEDAKAAGAEILMEPKDQDYGSRDFSLTDPEGNIWAFGTYAPGD